MKEYFNERLKSLTEYKNYLTKILEDKENEYVYDIISECINLTDARIYELNLSIEYFKENNYTNL